MRFPNVCSALSDRRLFKSLVAEFFGSAIFQLFAGGLPVETVNDQPIYSNPTTAATIAIANGIIYASLGIDDPPVRNVEVLQFT